MSIDGFLNILKPAGKTSFDIVAQIRRLTGEQRIGHAGTLDPDATGVLLICIGQATRVIQYTLEMPKTYQATIVLGITTDTYDASGKIIRTQDPSSIGIEQITQALSLFKGTIAQTPPMFSAIKHKGKRLYELARSGIEVEREPKERYIYRLDVLQWIFPSVTIEVECSSGTYIRSLAHDLGEMLGCGAHLGSLVRIKCGNFDISHAISIPDLEKENRSGYGMNLIYPLDEALLHWPAMIVDNECEKAIRNGKHFTIGNSQNNNTYKNQRCRAYSSDGLLLALLQWQPQELLWHPFTVFCTQYATQEEFHLLSPS